MTCTLSTFKTILHFGFENLEFKKYLMEKQIWNRLLCSENKILLKIKISKKKKKSENAF